jgi:hypothetical protein
MKNASNFITKYKFKYLVVLKNTGADVVMRPLNRE